MASNNMYRVGDYVYFESSATAPYQIRRIDELNKTSTGAVEAKVACYFRRRDVSIALINQAEKYYVNDNDSDDEEESHESSPPLNPKESTKLSSPLHSVTEMDKHRIKHRELFLSRQIECLPATHIRGKCSVTLYNDAEPLTNYLSREDTFYYKLIYDPSLKTLQEDRGSMRIGSDHQCEIQPLLKSAGDTDQRLFANLEEIVWKPGLLKTNEVDMFCLLVRAVGTLGRAFNSSTSARQPLLLGAAASAGRDITTQYAHDLLHEAGYDIRKALSLLLPDGQPIVCHDQLEQWSSSEAHMFEEALDKYSKVFPEIRSDYLPWKTHKALVELYYFWKTTDRYVRQRRTKLAAQEHKLKQVYIPNYSKPNPSVLYNGSEKTSRGCEGCAVTSSTQWYAWGPQNLLYRLCSNCWTYWKRYGGLKNPMTKGSNTSGRPCPEQRAQERSVAVRTPQGTTFSTVNSDEKLIPNLTTINVTTSFPSSTNPSLSIQTASSGLRYTDGGILPGGPRGTQCFKTPSMIRVARILCPDLVRPARLARRPGRHASSSSIRAIESTTDNSSKTGSLSLNVLGAVAQPIIASLTDPSALLSRRRQFPLLDDVIANLATRKGITLQPMDLIPISNGRSQPNGSVSTDLTSNKRSHSSNSNSTSNDMNGDEPLEDIASQLVPDLCNGTTKLPSNGDSPPPCKKQAVAACPNLVETSNGLPITDGPNDQ